MCFHAYASFNASINKHNRVLNWNRLVRNRLPNEHRWSLRINVIFQRKLLHELFASARIYVSKKTVESWLMRVFASRNHRVSKHKSVWAHVICVISICFFNIVANASRKICCNMAACRESNNRHFLCIYMPFFCIIANQLHSLRGFQKLSRVCARHKRVSQNKSVESSGSKLHSNRLCFSIRNAQESAAWQNQHCWSRLIPFAI
ncbi:Uncharacterised protein [Chlamydia trachomatis]|nr:Uncharacterised protein [Chlamydia trachomatis]